MYYRDYQSQEQLPPPVILPPHQQETFTSAVIIPIAQTLITAILAGTTFGLIWAAFQGPGPWRAGAIFGMLVCTTVWGISLRGWTMRLERLLNIDLNFDNHIGPPPTILPPERVKVELLQDGGRQMDIIDLPASPDQLRALARGVLGGRAFAEDTWAPGLFSKPQFTKLRDEMVSRGLVRWRNENAHAQGVDLTPAGKAVLKRLAEDSPTPTAG